MLNGSLAGIYSHIIIYNVYCDRHRISNVVDANLILNFTAFPIIVNLEELPIISYPSRFSILSNKVSPEESFF